MTAPQELTPLEVKAMRDLEIGLAKLRGLTPPEPPPLVVEGSRNIYRELYIAETSKSAWLQEQLDECMKLNEAMVEQTNTQEAHNADLRKRLKDALQHLTECVKAKVEGAGVLRFAVNYMIYDRVVEFDDFEE